MNLASFVVEPLAAGRVRLRHKKCDLLVSHCNTLDKASVSLTQKECAAHDSLCTISAKTSNKLEEFMPKIRRFPNGGLAICIKHTKCEGWVGTPTSVWQANRLCHNHVCTPVEEEETE